MLVNDQGHWSQLATIGGNKWQNILITRFRWIGVREKILLLQMKRE